MPILLENLDCTNSGYDAEYWADLDALYRGGKAFRERIRRFLPQNMMEPGAVYDQRLREASYRSHMGPMIDYFVAWLFSGSFAIRAKDDAGVTIAEPNPFYARFREDVGGDVDMTDFMKERFKSALVKKRAHWICELADDGQPDWPSNMAEFERRGFGRATLRRIDPEDLYDWELDEKGNLRWCVVHAHRRVRPSVFVTRSWNVETWKVYDATNVTTFEITYEDGKRPASTELISQKEPPRPHGFLQVPLGTLEIPEGLWIANRLADPQQEHFRMATGLAWAIKRTCYAMPVFHLEEATRPPVMGTGYYIMLGLQEKMEWSSPQNQSFDVISKEVDAQRNDMFRMGHQMALGLDNNAETVGRSADSKDQDNAATRVMLNAYGAIVAASVEETYEMVSDARGDRDVSWSIEGFSGYDTATAPEVIANAINAQMVNIPSKKFLTEIKVKVANATMPEMSQDMKDQIRQEITAGVASSGDMFDLFTGERPPPPPAPKAPRVRAASA